MRRFWVALGVALLVSACGERSMPRTATIGSPVPEYAAVSLSSDSVALADLQGQVVLLNVWATWCPPCREEIPALQRLHERYASEGLEVVGVSVDAAGEQSSVRGFIENHGVTYPIWLDPNERVSSTFRTTGVPSTFLIGRDGTLLWKKVGPITDDDPELTRRLEEALGSTT